jgi:cytochrome c oxidase subunit 2
MLFADAAILPQQASTFSGPVDDLFWFIHGLGAFFLALITGLIIVFVIKYRRGKRGVTPGPSHNGPLELTWSLVPVILVLSIFVWGFRGYLFMNVPPRGALDVSVTAQKWSWTFAYPSGATSNELHVPVNTPVRLTMHSTDVIHGFYVPEFRQKMNVLPGRYTSTWFEATREGEFQIYCTEYCGDAHSAMTSKVVVHTPEDYRRWLDEASAEVEPTAAAGEKLFQTKACFTCHTTDGKAAIGPSFRGVFGKSETMADGSSVTVDEEYIRESVLNPTAKVVQGFQPVMPTYQGQLKPNEIQALIEFIKGLR